MPAPICSDEEFIDAWRKLRSGTKVAKFLNCHVRKAMDRRRRMEDKYGIHLPAVGGSVSPPRDVRIEHKARINIEISDAVLPIAGDVHIWPGPLTLVQAAYIEMVRRLKPRYVILIGDVFDGARISRHPRIGFLENRPTVKDELQAVDDYLTALEQAAPKGAKLIWCLGNHDSRYESYLAQSAPEMEGVSGFHLKDRFPRWLPCWSVVVNEGKPSHTVIKHRWHNGIHATYNNALKSGVNFVTGHLHKLDARKWADARGHRYGIDTGFMADVDDPQFINYREDNPADWTSGFAVLSYKQGKLLRPEFVQKFDEHHVEWRGEVIKI